ncbi:hypothetical protein MCAP1_002396 [Malassezia caprae]|uniref:Smr domain-containing protein n=1 Tax=Malassezia caprae TaxID=1381934 RepID=A0AAF0IWN5_9BASI|nr:hypothetical protein MCAP1_002396 [Malassezia caprae]
MVQTLRQPERLLKFDPRCFKCVIVDEAHHATSPSYLSVLSHFNCDIQNVQKESSETYSKVPIFGFSATFARHDGVSLGQVFQEIVFHKDFLDMIDEQCEVASTTSDYVVSSLAKVVNQPDITSLVVRSWIDLAWKERKATLVFAVDIHHIGAVVSEFQDRGIDARAIHSGMSHREREQVMAAFRAGEFPVLVNCGTTSNSPKHSNSFLEPPEKVAYVNIDDPRELQRAMSAQAPSSLEKLTSFAWVDCGSNLYILGSWDGAYMKLFKEGDQWQGHFLSRNPSFWKDYAAGLPSSSPYYKRKVLASEGFAHAIHAADTFMTQLSQAHQRSPKWFWRTARWRFMPATAKSRATLQRLLERGGEVEAFVPPDITQGAVHRALIRLRHGAKTQWKSAMKRRNKAQSRAKAQSAYPPNGYAGQPGGPAPYPQGFQPGNEAPGGPAANSAQILGTTDIHLFDDNNKNAQNPHYKELRNKARSEGDKMANAFEASKQAYANGDGARAKELSNEGNMHKQNMEQLNTEARMWIFAANNADSPPDTVDLHGLYVKEALAKTEEAVQKAQAQNFPQLKLIVGKGIHSRDHVSHIKPAVEDLLRKYNLDAHVDEHNAGIVIVNLQGPPGGGQSNFTRDIAQQATGDEQQATWWES